MQPLVKQKDAKETTVILADLPKNPKVSSWCIDGEKHEKDLIVILAPGSGDPVTLSGLNRHTNIIWRLLNKWPSFLKKIQIWKNKNALKYNKRLLFYLFCLVLQ